MTNARTLNPAISAAVASLIATAGLAPQSRAQNAPEAAQIEEVQITGSRILRRDFEAPSPIVTIGSELFENQSTVALEASLNKLPQFAPAVTQFDTADVQPSATNTPGASSVSLRGLGPNRNLVLLDGRRAMPVNASMVVDVNSIPSAAIERIEIITGGASSVYGADAVGGVVNFILKKNFSGLQVDSQYGITEEGDGSEFRVSGLVGGNFADNRGNAMVGIEHSRRGSALQIDRPFYSRLFADPGVAGTSGQAYSATWYVPGPATGPAANAPSQAAVNAIFNQVAPGAVGRGSDFYLNTDGTVYTGADGFFSAVDPDGRYRYKGLLDNQFRKITNEGRISENNLDTLVSIPLTRYAAFARATFDITDEIRFFSQGTYNTNRTESLLGRSPAVVQWAASIPHGITIYAPSLASNGTTLPTYRSGGTYGLNCPTLGGCTNSQAFPVSSELGALLDSRPNPNANWTLHRTLDFIGPRSSDNDSKNFQLVTGFEGQLSGLDWTWDLTGSHGETDVATDISGVASRERYRAVAQAPNYGKGFFRPSIALGTPVAQCTSGLPLVADFPVSDDCISIIVANLQNKAHMEQNVVEANVQGRLFALPAGELRAALGASFRENSFSYQTDTLNNQSSFLDGVIGLLPAGDSFGRVSAKEVYGELLVPVLGNLPGVKRLDLEIGYRHSNYNTVGGVETYKILADWIVVDALRVRGGHQKASRAPNIGELFQARTQGFGAGTAFGFEPCSTATQAPFGVNPAFNPNATQARQICEALMGPTGAAVFYGAVSTTPGGGALSTVGNPNLDAETAKTWTAGLVFQSPFEQRQLNRLRASIDYYSIKITDAIGTTTFDAVYSGCLGAGGNPTGNPDSAACSGILRDPTNGTAAGVDVTYTNQGYIETAGLDLQVDWRVDFADLGLQGLPGTLSLNVLVNYLDTFKTRATPTSPLVEWKNTNGPNFPGLQAGAYKYKAFTTLSYTNGAVATSLRWRHLPSIRSTASATVPTTPIGGYASYEIFDLSGNWAIWDALSVRLGVDNVLDKQPPLGGRNATILLNGGTGTAPEYYDVLGRRYFIGMRAQF